MSDPVSLRLLPLTTGGAAADACGADCCAAEPAATAESVATIAATGTTMGTVPAGPDDRRRLLARRVRLLVAATITYNVIEAIVALTAGTVAGSTALIGFGLDSIVEVASAAAVAWQFSAVDHERRERTALKVIAVSFFALAAYVSYESVTALIDGHRPEHSSVGLFLAALSLLVMPVLSSAQRRAGRELGSRSAVADSKQTLLCTYLSAVLLVGLAVNSLFGWWWADPIAALAIAAVAVKEGREAWRGENCCVPVSRTDTAADTAGLAAARTAAPTRAANWPATTVDRRGRPDS